MQKGIGPILILCAVGTALGFFPTHGPLQMSCDAMTVAWLITRPLFFHDQIKARTSKRAKKMPEELPTDVKFVTANPRLAGIINSLSKRQRNGDTGEKTEEILLKDGAAQKEKHAVLSEMLAFTTIKGSTEDPKLSHVPAFIPSDEDLQISPFDEYKSSAPTLLYELGKLLDFFSQYEIIFPQGLINVLNYSWKELTEDALHTKKQWQSLAYRSVKAGARERSNKPTVPEATVLEKEENVKSNKNKKSVTQAENTKEKKNRKVVQNRPPGNKSEVPATQPHFVTISFSTSSRICEEKGWIFQSNDPEPEDLDWKALYRWAVERLQLAQIQINKQVSKLKEKGFDKPVILRHYDDTKSEAFGKPKKQACESSSSFILQSGKPHIPEIKKKDPSLKKLHYALIDGSSLT
ncbi:uncharacterized protein LOC115091341 [Rhinatrema bivittatum]|uniref:uncharacterized protein LOC115091341 n=1 Tax=Rhinatrema bivittatum TaxID=194408 RepID=UPI00112C6EE8|nr:uncharacterized protein LOC115091341 [Rhinatrema bivittatum]